MDMDITSHREYYRKRANAKWKTSQTTRTSHPCDPNSLWRKYTFIEKYAVTKDGSSVELTFEKVPEESILPEDAGACTSLDFLEDDPEPPIARCSGDCDTDDECGPGLRCFQRGSGSDNDAEADVPGCCGTGRRGTDYCYDPSDTSTTSNGVRIYEADGYDFVSDCGNCGFRNDEVDDDIKTGYSGRGYYNFAKNSNDDYIEWTVNIDENGDYPIAFRYSIGKTDNNGYRPLSVYVGADN